MIGQRNKSTVNLVSNGFGWKEMLWCQLHCLCPARSAGLYQCKWGWMVWRAVHGAWILEFHLYLSYKSVTSLWISTALLCKGTDVFSKLDGDQLMKSWMVSGSRSCFWLGKWQLMHTGAGAAAVSLTRGMWGRASTDLVMQEGSWVHGD